MRRPRIPAFCIALDLLEGYATSIEIECGEDEPPRWILVEYDHLPVRCCFCLSLTHQILMQVEAKRGRTRQVE